MKRKSTYEHRNQCEGRPRHSWGTPGAGRRGVSPHRGEAEPAFFYIHRLFDERQEFVCPVAALVVGHACCPAQGAAPQMERTTERGKPGKLAVDERLQGSFREMFVDQHD